MKGFDDAIKHALAEREQSYTYAHMPRRDKPPHRPSAVPRFVAAAFLVALPAYFLMDWLIS